MEGDVEPLEAKVERRGYAVWDDAPVDREAFEIALRDEGVQEGELDEVLSLRDEYITLAERYHALEDPRLGELPTLKQYGGEGGDDEPPFMDTVRAARLRLVDWMQGRAFEPESSELVEARRSRTQVKVGRRLGDQGLRLRLERHRRLHRFQYRVVQRGPQ